MSDTNITHKANDVTNKGPGATRQVASFKFKNYIKRSRDSDLPHIRRQAIISLRQLIAANPALIAILDQDLEENPALFLQRRLLRAEIRHQPIQPNDLGIRRVVGSVHVNNSPAASGTLIVMPTPGGYELYVLTCGHLLESISRVEAPFTVGFLLPGFHPIPISSIKVFKPVGNESRIQYSAPAPGGHHINVVTFPINTIPTNHPLGSRALVRYDGLGDVALCKLDISPAAAIIALNNLHIHNVQSNIINGMTVLSYSITQGGRTHNYNFHFINSLHHAHQVRMAANAHQNSILGYTDILQQVTKRVPGTHLYNTFIDTNYLTAYDFNHDAPTYYGMSGGPIFYLDPNNNDVHIYGVVKGAGGYGSDCKGTLLQDRLLQ